MRSVQKRSPKKSYFKQNSRLSTQQKKYCRCVLHVSSNNSPSCNTKRSYGSKGCYNSYAVCTKSTKRKGSVKCGSQYEFKNIPMKELKAFASLNKINTKGMLKSELVQLLNRKRRSEKRSSRRRS
jgi:hypothetical protein